MGCQGGQGGPWEECPSWELQGFRSSFPIGADLRLGILLRFNSHRPLQAGLGMSLAVEFH